MSSTSMHLIVAASLALAPFAFAHTDQFGPGTPDYTCQTPAEWQVHDYAAATNSRLVTGISDNNLEECGTTYGLFIAGAPECRELETRLGANDPGSPLHILWVLLCDTDRVADYDGDMEFAIGGALLAVNDGDGQTSGSLVCLGTVGHHGSTVSVEDQFFGTNVGFTVGADASLLVLPGEPDCGDRVIYPCTKPNSGLGPEVDLVLNLLVNVPCNPNDHLLRCHAVCTAPFGVGANGAYYVMVHPTLDGGPGGAPTGASNGHVFAPP